MKSTDWGKVANWYDELLEEKEGTYQTEVILPNIVRIADPKKGETVLDLACGQGFFSRVFTNSGAKVIGVDLGKELIEIAKTKSKNVEYYVSPADSLPFIKDNSIDKISIILAIQNIENVNGVFSECFRVLKPGGKLFIVMNHPAFRIPKKSEWIFDEESKTQSRKITGYLSEFRTEIDMNPGKKNSVKTFTFHRPLQLYFKLLAKNNFAITRLEEWISNKKSEPGVRAEEENRIRKEIPLFLLLEAMKR